MQSRMKVIKGVNPEFAQIPSNFTGSINFCIKETSIGRFNYSDRFNYNRRFLLTPDAAYFVADDLIATELTGLDSSKASLRVDVDCNITDYITD